MGTGKRRYWILVTVGAIAFASFVMASVALFLNTTALETINRLQRTPAAAPFRWNSIESEDNPTFVANLRAIGCPEETIQVLVQARVPNNVGESPAARTIATAISTNGPHVPESSNFQRAIISALPSSAEPVPNGLAGPSASVPASAPVADVVESAMPPAGFAANRLSFSSQTSGPIRSQITAVGSTGLAGTGRLAAPAPALSRQDLAGVANSTRPEEVITAPDDKVAIPVAFQPGNSDIPLAEQQQAQQDALQQEFVDAIHKNQDTAAPVSHESWQTAQMESDLRFKLLFGVQAFLAREKQSNLNPEGTAE